MDSSNGDRGPDRELRVLLVEDEAIIAVDTAFLLRGLGFTVLGPVSSGPAALALAAKECPDVVLMDIKLKGPLDGIAAAERLQRSLDVPIVFATSFSDQVTIDRAHALRPAGIIFKPYDEKDLRSTLKPAVERFRMERRLRESEQRYRVLVENNIAGVFRTRLTGEILDCNAAMAQILGYGEPADLIGRDVATLYADTSTGLSLQRELEEHKKIAGREILLESADGSQVWVVVSLAVTADNTVVGTAFDISTTKHLGNLLREQLAFEEKMLDTIPVPLFYRDHAGVYRSCNTAFEVFFSKPREAIIGKRLEEVSPEAYSKAFAESDARLLRSKGVEVYETLTLDGQGRECPIVSHKAAVTGEDGAVKGIVGIIFDVSERKRIEEAVRVSEERLQLVLNSAQDAIIMIDGDGNICVWNDAAVRTFGFTAQEVLGKNLHELLAPPSYREAHGAAYAEFQHSGTGAAVGSVTEVRALRKSGEEFPAELSLSTFQFEGRWQAIGIVRDISERKRRDQALRRSESRFRLISENVGDLIALLSPDGLVKYVSPSLLHFGLNPREFTGSDFLSIVHPDDRPTVEGRVREEFKGGKSELIQCRFSDGAGGWRTVEMSIDLLVEDTGASVLTVSRDITERVRNDQELRALQQAIDQSPVAVMMTEIDGTITYVNAAFVRNSGYSEEEILGRTPSVLRSPATEDATYAELWRTILSGQDWNGTLCNRRKDERLYWERSTITPIVDRNGTLQRFVAIKEDITDQVFQEQERAKLEQQLRERNEELESTVAMLKQTQGTLVQSEKLASIGQLTAGIAHEINNPLAFVASNLNRFGEYFADVLGLLQSWRDLAVPLAGSAEYADRVGRLQAEEQRIDLAFLIEDFQRLMAHTQSGTGRIKTIVEQLRGFTHLSGDGCVDSDINAALEETVTITWNEIKYKATVKRDLAVLPPVHCNIGEIKQVLVNLVVNAAHAIDEKGLITLRTRAEDNAVAISVEDTGHGIPVSSMKKIFDPFFTTKPVGKGTGLGLWISNTIVRKHNGTISVESEVGKGTVFTVHLPLQPPDVTDAGGGG